MKILPLAAAAALTASAAPAALTLTVNPSTGGWDFSATSSFEVKQNLFFGNYAVFWFGSVAGSGGAASSSAPFSYSGVYNGGAVSGSGTINYAVFSTGGLPQSLNLNFGTALPADGTFTSFSVTPGAVFGNASAAADGLLTPSFDAGMVPVVNVRVVPEPAVPGLAVFGLAFLLRRRR